MCGIAGIYTLVDADYSSDSLFNLVSTMINKMIHRGPDGYGVWVDTKRRCSLGHRRLSIIDTSDAGLQPMTYNDNDWVITFNGEIYNYKELRDELKQLGVIVRGKTDTEVLLACLSVWGIECVHKLDGMFSFAAYQVSTENLYLARDPFGEKPLYYKHSHNEFVVFSSELTSLETTPGFSYEIDENSIAELLMFQYIGAPRSIYKDVRKLPQGHWLKLSSSGHIEIKRYFNFKPGSNGYSEKPKFDLVDELEDILVRSIQKRLISDVPVGAFLSGGVDSSTVCALAKNRLGIELNTYSIGFEGYKGSEHEIARKIARHLGLHHKDKIVVPNLREFISKIGQLLDEPNGDSSCLPTYILTQFARQEVTVALSGDGGDELFGGYGRYMQTINEYKSKDVDVNAGCSYYNSNKILVFNPGQLYEFLGFMPKAAVDHLQSLIAGVNYQKYDLLCNLRSSDVENYLPGAVLSKVDRMSMQNSMEVRTPFLNVELAKFSESISPDLLLTRNKTKVILKELAYRYLPKNIINLPKQGFGLPVNSGWGRTAILAELNEALGSSSVLRNWIGDFRSEEFLKQQNNKDSFSIYQVWSVIILEKWLRSRPVKMPKINQINIFRSDSSLQKSIGCIDERAISLVKVCDDLLVLGIRYKENLGFNVVDFALAKQLIENRLLLDKSCNISPDSKFNLDDLSVLGVSKIDISSIRDLIKKNEQQVLGKTLILIDQKYSFNFAELVEILMFLGVQRFIAPSRNEQDWWIDYTFNSKTILLGPEIMESLKLKRAIKRIFAKTKDGLSIAKLPSCFKIENDRDQAIEYSLIVDKKQIVPYIYSHKEIRNAQKGMYSIWNGHVLYKKSHFKYRLIELFSSLFISNDYVVDNNKANFRLPINASKFYFKNFDEERFAANIGKLPVRSESTDDKHGRFKIVVYTHALAAGGAERQWCNLSNGLSDLGEEVIFVVDTNSPQHEAYARLLREGGIKLLSLEDHDKYSDYQSIRTIRQRWGYIDIFACNPFGESMAKFVSLLESEKPDIIISQLDAPNIKCAISAIIAKVPKIIISFRNYSPIHFPHFYETWFKESYQSLIINHRIFLTGNSRLGNNDYAKWLDLDPANIIHIKNSFSLKDFCSEDQIINSDSSSRQVFIKPEHKVIVGAFRLNEEKAPYDFLSVCYRILRYYKNVIILICGDGPMRKELEEWVIKNGVNNNFQFCGNLSDLHEIVSRADLLLHTAIFEGMPNIIVEALYLKCPIVATSVGAIPELIVHGVNGFICERGDIESMVNYCRRILDDEFFKKNIDKVDRSPIKLPTHSEAAKCYLKIFSDEEQKSN